MQLWFRANLIARAVTHTHTPTHTHSLISRRAVPAKIEKIAQRRDFAARRRRDVLPILSAEDRRKFVLTRTIIRAVRVA